MTTKYLARLDGQIVGTRKTERAYSFAVVVSSTSKLPNTHKHNDGKPYVIGWSSTEEGAVKMSRSIQSRTPYYLATELVAIVPAEVA